MAISRPTEACPRVVRATAAARAPHLRRSEPVTPEAARLRRFRGLAHARALAGRRTERRGLRRPVASCMLHLPAQCKHFAQKIAGYRRFHGAVSVPFPVGLGFHTRTPGGLDAS